MKMHNPENYISGSMKNVTEVYRVQILLAYFLNRINQLCTPNQLTEIATGEGIVNYFDYTAAITAMLENGTIELAEIDGTEYYRLTEKGSEGAENFKKQVEKSLRDKIYASGLRLFAQLKNERDISFDVTPEQNGYNVRCTFKEGELTLMDIQLYAPDEDQANFIKSKVRMNPTDFYCRVIDYIIENEEYVPSVIPDAEDGQLSF